VNLTRGRFVVAPRGASLSLRPSLICSREDQAAERKYPIPGEVCSSAPALPSLRRSR
jgi:hypothetical protein